MASVRDSTFSYVHLDNPNRVLYMEKWRDDSIPFDSIDTQQLFDATSSLLPFNLLEGEEEDGSIPLQPASFGANLYKNRKANKDRTWTDLGIRDKFMYEGHSHNPNPNHNHNLTDKTMLGFLRANESSSNGGHMTVADFLSNGYQVTQAPDILINSDLVNDSTFSVHHGDFFNHSIASEAQAHSHSQVQSQGQGQAQASIGTTTSGAINTSFQSLRSGSIGSSNHQGMSSIQTPRVGKTRQSSSDRIFQTPITRIMR